MKKQIVKPDAIFFDLDDTISSFDSVCDTAWYQCCQNYIEKYKSSFTYEELRKSIDETKRWYWADPVRHKEGRENLREARRDVVRFSLDTLGISDEKQVVELADDYTALQDSLLALLPGSLEALERLKEAGVRMAVITNGASPVQREKLQRFKITEYFEKVIIDSEVGYSKPDRKIFEYALKEMKLIPSQVWMIGDNLVWDVGGAKQLGIFSVWNDYKKKGLPKNCDIIPDLIVSSIYELSLMI